MGQRSDRGGGVLIRRFPSRGNPTTTRRRRARVSRVGAGQLWRAKGAPPDRQAIHGRSTGRHRRKARGARGSGGMPATRGEAPRGAMCNGARRAGAAGAHTHRPGPGGLPQQGPAPGPGRRPPSCAEWRAVVAGGPAPGRGRRSPSNAERHPVTVGHTVECDEDELSLCLAVSLWRRRMTMPGGRDRRDFPFSS